MQPSRPTTAISTTTPTTRSISASSRRTPRRPRPTSTATSPTDIEGAAPVEARRRRQRHAQRRQCQFRSAHAHRRHRRRRGTRPTTFVDRTDGTPSRWHAVNVVNGRWHRAGTNAGGTGGQHRWLITRRLQRHAGDATTTSVPRRSQLQQHRHGNPPTRHAVPLRSPAGRRRRQSTAALGADTLGHRQHLVNVTTVNDEPAGADNSDTTPDRHLVFDAANFTTGFSDPRTATVSPAS